MERSCHRECHAARHERVISVDEAASVEPVQSLGQLWARSRIASLADYNQLANDDERVREVTSLGITFNLLTAFTSFVAVDSVAPQPGGDLMLVKQALPLPHGVENSAVGLRSRRPPSLKHGCSSSSSAWRSPPACGAHGNPRQYDRQECRHVATVSDRRSAESFTASEVGDFRHECGARGNPSPRESAGLDGVDARRTRRGDLAGLALVCASADRRERRAAGRARPAGVRASCV